MCEPLVSRNLVELLALGRRDQVSSTCGSDLILFPLYKISTLKGDRYKTWFMQSRIQNVIMHKFIEMAFLRHFYFPVSSFFYVPPQKVAGYYVIPSELLSVCPSVHPSSVDHSCPLHNFDTIRDNFMKLSTNIKHDQMTCGD